MDDCSGEAGIETAAAAVHIEDPAVGAVVNGSLVEEVA